MKNPAKLILILLVTMSILMGAYEGLLYFRDIEVSEDITVIWGIIFVIFLALWVKEDSKAHPDIYKPFDYGFLVFIYCIPYLPYYLVKTRGWLVGFAFLLSIMILFNIGWLFQWLIYWAGW